MNTHAKMIGRRGGAASGRRWLPVRFIAEPGAARLAIAGRVSFAIRRFTGERRVPAVVHGRG